MASYKVLQDIEAEDTLIGPLTLRQCIYAAIAIVCIYLSVVFVSKGVPFMVVFMLPFIAFGVFFAFPWSKQQTTEVWALAKIRFFLKPRKRIWNQTGAKQLVKITAPKVVVKAYASSLTPNEVKSRLRALADTIDSRGWAVKNVELGYYAKTVATGSDRLVGSASLPQEVPNYDAAIAQDIFDVDNNPIAQNFTALMSKSANDHRDRLVQQMEQGPAPEKAQEEYWHMHAVPVIDRPATASAQRVPALQLPAVPATDPGLVTSTQTAVTAAVQPAIIDLANNNDLDIATIAREAQARRPDSSGEVVISLH